MRNKKIEKRLDKKKSFWYIKYIKNKQLKYFYEV